MQLSAREMEVARLVAEGLADKEIADILMIHIGTVKTYLDRISRKLGTRADRNRRTAVARFIERLEAQSEPPTAAA